MYVWAPPHRGALHSLSEKEGLELVQDQTKSENIIREVREGKGRSGAIPNPYPTRSTAK